MSDLVILGAGGHARVLLSVLELHRLRPVGCLAAAPPDAAWPSDVPYLGSDDALDRLEAARVLLVNGIGSVGSTAARRAVFEAGVARGFGFAEIVHPAAIVSQGSVIGEGAQIMAGAIVQNGSEIGVNAIINTGAIIDHDCRIGAHCHIAPGACLSGSVEIEPGVHVGTGACVIQGIRIGANALIGAGAVVVRDVVQGATVVGNPARPLPSRAINC